MLLDPAIDASTTIATTAFVSCSLTAPYIKVWLTQNTYSFDIYSQNTHIELNISEEEFALYNFQ